MDRRWASAGGLTLAVAAAIAGAWALRRDEAPPTAPPQVESMRQDGATSMARSLPATVEPAQAPPAAAAPAVAPASPIRQAPRFDVVRADPDGSAVVAGRAEPGSTVTLLVDGKPAGEVGADANGQFVILPPPLAAGERSLTLESRAKDGAAATSPQAVTILGARQDGRVVALAEPGAPTRILSDAAPAPKGETRIRSVEAEQGGAFYASGTAPPGATVRLYLNDGAVAETKATAEGAWSVRIEKGMTPGVYDVRADHIDAAGKVAGRAQVTFDYPAAPVAAPATRTQEAKAPQPDAQAPDAGTKKPAETSVAQVRTQQVTRGDSLWRMSAKLYGSGLRYTEIYAANAGQIRNPDLIYPGQILVAPQKP